MAKLISIILIFFVPLFLNSAEIITVSPNGSYTTTFPNCNLDQYGNRTGNPPQGEIWKTENITGPIPTNDWWSSVLWLQYSERMYPHPLSVWARNKGLEIHSPTTKIVGVNGVYEPRVEYMHPENGADLYVQNTGFTPADARADKYSDWSVDILMASGSKNMKATVSHGSPFVYFTLNGCSTTDKPKIALGSTGSVSSIYNGKNYLKLSVNNHYYGIFAPSQATWSLASDSKSIEITMPSGKYYFSVVLLPDGSDTTFNTYKQYGYSFITDTKANFTYDETKSVVTTTFTLTTEAKEGTETKTLFSLYPHQWRNNNDIGALLTSYIYPTIRGKMKVLCGNQFTTKLTYSGILPWMPKPLASSGFSEQTLTNLINEVTSKTDNEIIGNGYDGTAKHDSYVIGKIFNRLSQLAAVGDQVNHPDSNRLITLSTNKLVDWLTTEESEVVNDDANRQMLYFDTNWKTLIAFPSGYYADAHLNDHHFHLGYWVYAAAQKAMRDKTWGEQWKNMVDRICKEYACYDRNDPYAPYLRNFDPYEGHSWADGKAATAHGNNQESSSEAINAYAALILWGETTGNITLRNYGIWLYTTEVSAIQNYWFDIYQDILDPGYGKTEAAVNYSGKYEHAIFWEGGPEQVHGINWLPLAGHSLYLGYDTDYLTRSIDAIAPEVQFYKDKGIYSANMANAQWKDITAGTQALVDPDKALTLWNTSVIPEFGETKAHTYQWIHSLKSYGQVDTTVTANTPLYAVFHKGLTRTYAVYNAGTVTRNVTFSDGFTLSAPPSQLSTGSRSITISVPPTNIIVTSSDRLANISFTKVDDASGYIIKYRNSSETKTIEVNKYTTNYFIAGLTNDTPYYFSVATKNYAGTSSYSAEVSGICYAKTVIPSPVELQSATAGSKKIILSWSPCIEATWYLIKYGTQHDNHNITVNAGYSTSYTLDGLNDGTIYYLTVVAANSAGECAKSNEKTAAPGMLSSYEKGVYELSATDAKFWLQSESATTVLIYPVKNGGGLGGLTCTYDTATKCWSTTLSNLKAGDVIEYSYTVISNGVGDAGEEKNKYRHIFAGSSIIDTTQPTAPGNLTAGSITDSSVKLSWNASTDNIRVAGYRIYRNGLLIQDNVSATNFTVTNLTQLTQYKFTVTAFDDARNESVKSNEVTVNTIKKDTVPPTAPTNLIASDITATSCNLSWSASTDDTGVTGYQILSNGIIINSAVSATSAVVNGLNQDTNYTFTVKAFDLAGNLSPESSPVNIKTPVDTNTGYTFTGDLNNGLIDGVKVHYTTTANYDGVYLIITFDGGAGFEWVYLYTPGYNNMQVSGNTWIMNLAGYTAGQSIEYYFCVKKNGQEANNSDAKHKWTIKNSTNTPTPSQSPTPTKTPTATITYTPTASKTPTATYTFTPTATNPFTPTATMTATNTATPTKTPTATATQSSNIAKGKTVTVSSTEGSGYEGSRAVDGSSTTRWSSIEGVDPQWIIVDLGKTYSITKVVLKWEAAYAKAYKVQVSANNSTWSDKFSTTTENGGTDTISLSASGRYVRIYGTVRATSWGYSLWEVEIYGTDSPVTPTKTPTATATKTPTATYTPTPTKTFTPTATSTFTPTATKTPTATITIPTAIPTAFTAAADEAHTWLVSQLNQTGTGLVDSIEDYSAPNVPIPNSYTYDQAVAIIAFLLEGDIINAKTVLNTMKSIQAADGSWVNSYWNDSTSYWGEELRKHVGPIAWMAMSVMTYERITGDTITYRNMALKALDWCLTFPTANGALSGGMTTWDLAGGAWSNEVWSSTEQNLDAYAALIYFAAAVPEKASVYTAAAAKIKNFLDTVVWDASKNRFRGGFKNNTGLVDPNVPMDVNPWAVQALGPTGTHNYGATLDYVENANANPGTSPDNPRYVHNLPYGNGTINLYDFDWRSDGAAATDPKSGGGFYGADIWFEGSAFMSISHRICGNEAKADAIIAEIIKKQGKDGSKLGGIPYSLNATNNSYWKMVNQNCVSSTGWLIIAIHHWNPFTAQPVNGTVIPTPTKTPTATATKSPTPTATTILSPTPTSTYTPTATPTVVKSPTPTPTQQTIPLWKASINYLIGDIVSYNGLTWKCVYAHTSNEAWYPGASGLWFWEQQ